MKAALLAAIALLSACGVDGPPERPVAVQQVAPADPPATYADAGAILRTTAHSVSAGSAAVSATPDGS